MPSSRPAHGRALLPIALAATLAGALPATLAAQGCTGSLAPAHGIAVFAQGGAFGYAFSQTVRGPQFGAGAAIDLPGPVTLEVDGMARRPQSGATLFVGRAKALIDLHVPAVANLCLTAGLGAADLSDSGNQTSNITLAVPIGLRFGTGLHLGVARVEPYVEPFVLFAQATGNVFDVETSGGAAGGGADAGVTLHAGPLVAGVTLRYARISAVVGPHPEADRAVLVRLGLAF